MERKIGEIFEYNGEWYQCVEGTNCRECDFSSNNVTCDIHGAFKCTCKGRSDETSVVFKKLEKVGEPFIGKVHIQLQRYKIYTEPIIDPAEKFGYVNEKNTIAIEVKQTKEDMEEKEQCGDNRFEVIEKAKKHLLSSTNIESSKEEMKVLDNFLIRCWQMGWLDKYNDTKHSNSEKIGKNLKPFSLEAAKLGKPVCTRDGRKARIICFDGKGDQPIIALVEAKGNKDALIEKVERYFINGHSVFEVRETNNDLMMLPEKKEGWVNVYYNRTDGITFSKHPYISKEEAIKNAGTMSNRIDTVNISWKE